MAGDFFSSSEMQRSLFKIQLWFVRTPVLGPLCCKRGVVYKVFVTGSRRLCVSVILGVATEFLCGKFYESKNRRLSVSVIRLVVDSPYRNTEHCWLPESFIWGVVDSAYRWYGESKSVILSRITKLWMAQSSLQRINSAQIKKSKTLFFIAIHVFLSINFEVQYRFQIILLEMYSVGFCVDFLLFLFV